MMVPVTVLPTLLIVEPNASPIYITRVLAAPGSTGARAAKGEIIAFTDSDCVPPPDWLEKIQSVFSSESVVAVAGGYSGHEGLSFIGRFAHLELSRRRKRMPRLVQTAVTNNLAVRKSMFDAVNGFPEIFSGATLEDMVFTFHISGKGDIVWLRDNGVGHHFHETITGYLRQQYTFARDTVIVFDCYPELRRIRTHQGRAIYIETLLAGLSPFTLVQPWPWTLLVVGLLWLLNSGLLFDIFREIHPFGVLKAMVFIPVRDCNWIRGTIMGLLIAILNRLTASNNE